MHLLQRLVRAVQRVLVAVVLERVRGQRDAPVNRLRRAADLVVADGRPVGLGVVALVVDVVAEADHEVEVLLGRHQLVAVVEAVRVVRAAEEREADRLVGVERQRGAEAPDGRVSGRRREAVVVLLVGLQTRDLRLDRVVLRRAGLDVLVRDDVLEGTVGGDFERDRAGLLDAVDARPQGDAGRRRIAGDDPVGELASAQRLRVLVAVGELRGEDDGGRERCARAQELGGSAWGGGPSLGVGDSRGCVRTLSQPAPRA